ncbi:uncharacterized protein LOC110875368 [Helianthus annuus]|uniref:uncharacterized protein LOC110875368 n=1 Tax=Helianthus annuus TaxID=4232 RepID=UPI000B8F0752|nr:uncharacterized protein LOC110875368 [Helianthus annuus]
MLTAPPGFLNQDPDSDLKTFFRIFVCFDALKKGFLAGYRKLLCLDGCFLKTFLGGMLLAAIRRDANDQMYPLAWAVVEGENNDSWEWFMEELRKCLDVHEGGKGWTFVSDQHKGILNAIALVWGNAEHRNYARHIYGNWHKKFKSDELKEVYWQACRSYNEAYFLEAIKEMNNLDREAVDAFIKQNPKGFVRCYLQNDTKCCVIVNNMAETFNGTIVQSRAKHIIHMLEDIRVSMMRRITTKHSEVVAFDGVVCPRIQEKLDQEKYWAYKSFLGKNAEDFVHEWYHKDQYLKSYEHTIPSLPSEKYWPKVDYPLDPPPIKIAPGRAKKNRKRDPHEDPKKPGKLTKHGIQMTCSNCNEKGNNVRKCSSKGKAKVGAANGDEGGPKQSRARPKGKAVMVKVAVGSKRKRAKSKSKVRSSKAS